MPSNSNRNNRHARSSGGLPTSHAFDRDGAAGGVHSKSAENISRSRTRFADRRRKRGRILIALAIICTIEIVCAVLTSPSLSVKHTLLEGIADSSSLSPAEMEITRNAAILPNGTNWILAPVSIIEQRLVKLPWVRSAHVTRRLPTDIAIVIEPRTPHYALLTHNGSFEAADDNVPIRALRPTMENRLPPVILDSTEIAQPGSVAANQSLNAAVRILEQTRSDAMLRIAKIEIDRSSNIWLNMKAGIRINFGRCEDVDKKVTLMRSLLSHDRENRFAELNVSSPDWPAGRLREPPKHGSPEEVAAAPSNAQDTPLDQASRTISSRTRPGTH